MDLLTRVKNILLTPSTEWPAIDGEVHTVKGLYLGYLLPLAGLVAVATLVGSLLWGFSAGPVTVRYGFGDALGLALMGFVMSMVLVWVLAWIIDLLAPTFQGRRQFDKAFAVAAFSMTGALVGGMAAILPALATLLGLVGGVYSLFLLYKGLPVLMKTPPAKALGYTAVVIIAAIVCNVVIGALLATLAPNPWRHAALTGAAGGEGTSITISTPAGSVTTTQGRLDEASRRIEEAASQAQKASEAGDPQAASKAAAEAIAAITGALPGGQRVALAPDALKAWLPERIDGLERETFEVQGGTAVGIVGATARARYGSGNRRIDLEVVDAGAASGVIAIFSHLATGERETETVVEKSYQRDKRRFSEKRWKSEDRAEFDVVLANGVMISAKSEGIALDALSAAVRGLGLEKLEAATPAAKKG